MERSSRSSKASIAPRSINVRSFAESRGPELESLQTIVSNLLNDDFRSRKKDRRRTTGHDDRIVNKNGSKRKRKRNRRGDGSGGSKSLLGEGEVEGEKKVSRRVRRKMEFKDGLGDGFSSSGDGIKRLRTHVWHAKRFTMTKLWGFHLPLGLQGRGRGSRAVLKWYNHGALLHDASYFTCVELEGLEVSILSVLNTVLLATTENEHEDVHGILSGTICGNAMLWIWIHASAFDEGFEALKEACSKLITETGQGITLSSLDGKVAQFRVMGCKAWQLLQKVLQVVSSDNGRELNTGSVLKPHSDPHQVKYHKLESEDEFASHSIISLTVKDPRDLSVGSVLASQSETPLLSSNKTPKDTNECGAANTDIMDDGDNIEVSSLELASHNMTDGTLWDAKSGICPPVNEKNLSVEKQKLRLSSFSIADLSSKASADSCKMKGSRSCPIMLIKDVKNKGLHTGWTMILPVRWVKTFWMPLVLNGAHVIGLREKHWITSEMGLSYFPSDFPDCNAYASYKAFEAATFDQEADRRPLAVRPVKVPFSSPWNCVKLALDEDFSTRAGSNTNQNVQEAGEIHDGLPMKSDSVSSDIIQQNHEGTRFPGTVARTASKLSCLIDQNFGQNFPLFPFSANKKRLSDWVPGKPIDHTQIGITLQKNDRDMNFVRVILHAFRNGVFEEGAVICAPLPADIESSKSSLDSDEERLHIPQSSASTYFSEDTSGKWILRLPHDPNLFQTHRCPIGFVTSGFVRGSKRAAACAFCEASLLARLRQEQWRNLPVKKRKKDIYVLVRNLRSNAYRLATANIVLEHQAIDLAFL